MVAGVFPPIAQNLITLFGRDTVFIIPSSTPIDPARPDLGNTTTSTEITAPAVFKRSQRAETDQSETYDTPVLVAALDLGNRIPSNDWRIRDGGKTYSIVNVSEVAPGTDRVLYEVLARG